MWITFKGPIKEGHIILHDDSVPLNPDGTYKNHLSHLRLGSRSDNMIERYSTITPECEECDDSILEEFTKNVKCN